jgi:uncharacterized protein (TIGR00297 family)
VTAGDVGGHPLLGLALSAAGAALVLATRQATRGAALSGFVVAALAATGLGLAAIAPLALFVLGSGALTHAGRAAKEHRGMMEADRGRRGARHVAAKLGLPALCGALALLRPPPAEWLGLAYTATLSGAFADTAATEAGPLGGSTVLAIRRGRIRRVPHGEPGGVSGLGLAAGALGAAGVAATAWLVGLLPGGRAAVVAAATGFAASVLESGLGGTALGARMGHHGRNAALSALSAGGALAARALGWTGG